MLTKSVDMGSAFEGTEKGDIYYAFDDGASSTVNNFDTLDGKEGNDILEIQTGVAMGISPDLNLTSIETVNVKSAAATLTLDGSNWEGTNTLNVTQATDATLTAAATTDVNISGAKGNIVVKGGNDVVVNDATKDKTITVGDNAAGGDATGTITITDTDNSGLNTITVEGGTDVTVTATATASTTGDIVVGDAIKGMATGKVVVTQNLNSDGTANVTGGNITVTGGKTVDVTVNSTITAKDKSANKDIDNSTKTIKVNSDGKTTDVTVKQTETVTEFVTPETALVNGKTAITFKAMTAGQALAIDGLSFHATKDLTAAEVAAAFANLTDGDAQANGGKTANGYYTGSLLTAGLTTGAANGAVVEFISDTKTPVSLAPADIAGGIIAGKMIGYLTGTTTNASGIEPAAGTETTGAYAAEEKTTDSNGNTVTYGAVEIEDDATASIKTITVDGYGAASKIGNNKNVDALTDLTLKNGSDTMTVKTAVASLNLTVDDVQADVTLTATNLKTLNLTTTGEEESVFGLVAAKVETLNITANADLDIDDTQTNLSALKTATITGAGNVDLGDLSASANFATLTASASTGDISATVAGNVTAVTTGSGNDTITVDTTTISQAIDLGAGNDTLVLSNAGMITVPTAAVAGGTGTDTISMTFASAASYNSKEDFKNAISGFERLTINDGAAGGTINLANLGFTNYVTTTGNASATFANAVAALGDGNEKITFIYNGISYTSLAIAAAADTDVNTALDGALDANNVALGAGKVTATYTNTNADITITVDTAGNSLVGGTYDDAADIDATNTALTLQKMDSNGTLVLAGTGAVTVQVTDADKVANTSDVLNVTANVAGTDYSYGTVTVANVETVNITANDTLEDDDSDGTVATGETAVEEAALTLTATHAKTVNVYGSADVDLTLTGTTAVTLVDASKMTGALTVTASGTTATTIKGGSAGDSLTAATGVVDTLYGYAGDDSLTSGTKTIMYGGEGNDTFNISFVASQTVNDYAVIKDLASGDTIKMFVAGGADMAAFAKLSAANTPNAAGSPSILDYANAAALQNTTDNGAVWFTLGENTFIFIEGGTANATDAFNASEDNLVMITGLVDLSTASFNAQFGTLEIA